MAAPVAVDQELELRIDSLAYGGSGVARANGFVVFVRRGLPGDRVRARVTKVKRNHAEALAVEVVETAARRDRARGRAVPLPQQARVLVHGHASGTGARLPSRGPLGRGA